MGIQKQGRRKKEESESESHLMDVIGKGKVGNWLGLKRGLRYG